MQRPACERSGYGWGGPEGPRRKRKRRRYLGRKARDARIWSRFQGRAGLGGKDRGDSEQSGRHVAEKKLKVE